MVGGIGLTILGLATGEARAQSPTSTASIASAASGARVLQVGTFHGIAGKFKTIQAAVNAAHPGDWILIAPGTYHERGAPDAGVRVTTPGLHLRGLDRNSVIVDGTDAGSCSSDPRWQNSSDRNGIEIFKVDGVSVENLTVCNFLGVVNGSNGNQIWWNGGDGSGQIGLGSYHGAYLTATSTFYQPGAANLAQYGIFASNARGPGLIEHSYAGNMSDSAFYVGACPDCNAVLSHVHAQNSAQGFSGSNAGGHLVLEESEWDHNQAGIVPSALASFDLPSVQNGACPSDPDASCTLIQFNFVHDNNNPNTPAAGLAATVAVGTGIDLSGGRNNTVQYNLVTNNGSWGILLNDYADYTPTPNPPGYCRGGVLNYTPPADINTLYVPLPIPCYFHSFGNRVVGNLMWGNGSFGNPTNGDLANAAVPFRLDNCFSENVDLSQGSPTSSPANLQDPSVAGVCGRKWNTDTSSSSDEFLLTAELGCASLGPASGACAGLPPPWYPLQTQVQLLPIPHEPGMPNACQGVPPNSWCPSH
jgi:parallel beta-helix repeat protein